MRRAQEVEDALHRREGLDRHLDEERVPGGHRAVPETGPLEGEEVDAPVRFPGDEDRVVVDEAGEVQGRPDRSRSATTRSTGLKWVPDAQISF